MKHPRPDPPAFLSWQDDRVFEMGVDIHSKHVPAGWNGSQLENSILVRDSRAVISHAGSYVCHFSQRQDDVAAHDSNAVRISNGATNATVKVDIEVCSLASMHAREPDGIGGPVV